MKPDEIELIRLVMKQSRPTVSEMNEVSPRWAYLLTKWVRRGFWEYGVSLRTGWMTEAGIEWAREAIAREVAK